MAELELIPVHTRILTHHDDIVDAIKEYAGADITDHDIVCTAESVVAITQNRYVRPEELNVCWQARLMNRFVPAAGSMASIYGMQAAMDEEGKWNMLFSFILGAVAKVFGKRGVFYARCRQASLIDDVTGTFRQVPRIRPGRYGQCLRKNQAGNRRIRRCHCRRQ